MAARFTKLNNAIKSGLATMQAKAAIDQVEYWEEQLQNIDTPGAKGILSDLHSLKTKLQADDIDGAAVKKVLASLGEKTSKISERVEDESVSEQLKTLGTDLDKAA